MLRDVLFETAASADLAPSKEEKHLLPGTVARPGDVTIRRWVNGKDGAIDVTVTAPSVPQMLLVPPQMLERLSRRPTSERSGTQLKLAAARVSSSCLLLWRLLVAFTPEQWLK